MRPDILFLKSAFCATGVESIAGAGACNGVVMRTASESRRYLALWLPSLSIDRMRLTKAEAQSAARDNRPFVLAQKENNALCIASADPIAVRLGLQAGLSIADARARVLNLLVLQAEPAADFALLTRMAGWCERFTPLTALDHPHGLMLDVTGCAHLFGGEAALAQMIRTKLQEFGFQAKATIAGTPEAARAICRFGELNVVPAKGESAAVRFLPVAALGVGHHTTHALLRAGLKTVGDLMDRPQRPLAARFGEILPAQLRRILGFQDIRITPHRPLPDCVVEQNFSEPATQQSAIEATLKILIVKAAGILEARGEGGRKFEASFFRADGLVRRIMVETARPSRDSVSLLRLFSERLEALTDPLDPGFGFDLIRLSIRLAEAFDVAQTSLDGNHDTDEEFSGLADRLGARLGRNNVRKFIPAGSHIPELAEQMLPAISAGEEIWPSPRSNEPPARPLYMFDPPQPIETLAEVPDGPPVRFTWRRVVHEIICAEGPERIAPEWWNEAQQLTRDYYRIEDTNGRRFWVYREGLYVREITKPRWFMHGLFA